MAARINPKWAANIESSIAESSTIDETLTFRAAAQWLIATLSRYGLPYKVYQLGCGVVRVTMTTDTCPCCKRKL